MLFANALPEHVVVPESPPALRNLCSSTQGRPIEISQNLEAYLSRKNRKRVDSDEPGEELRDEGQLGEAAHR